MFINDKVGYRYIFASNDFLKFSALPILKGKKNNWGKNIYCPEIKYSD